MTQDPASKRRYLIALPIRGLRADFVGELATAKEPRYKARVKRCIDSLDSLLALEEDACEREATR